MTLRNSLQCYGSFSNLQDQEQDDVDDVDQPKDPNPLRSSKRGGGRRPGKLDQVESTDSDMHDEDWYLQPSTSETEVRLLVVQITDVYTLENFPSLKTMLQELRKAHAGNKNTKIISILTGDFLSPYLLSSIDRGRGMMEALVETPLDYVIWGNHEADIDHETTCQHVKYFHDRGGIWINSNMTSHDAMEYQKDYDIVEVGDRKIGLVAVLSNDPALYAPNAFGGAKIDDPWKTLTKYKTYLEEEQGCDVVLPCEHLYVPDDHITCQKFDFPVVLSGHDHHKVDEVVCGTRLIKPGMDGLFATVLELSWSSEDQRRPNIRSTFVPVPQRFDPCPILQEQTNRAYDVLEPLQKTQLMDEFKMERYEPLSSENARGQVTTMGILICSLLKQALNNKNTATSNNNKATTDSPFVDAVILMGGNIRGGQSYPLGSFFSLEMLEAEIKSDEVVGIVPIPGKVLEEGIICTYEGDPKPGWMQHDDGIVVDNSGTKVLQVASQPLDPHRVYHVATKISDLGNGQSPPFRAYFTKHPELLPAKGSYWNIPTELMGYFARRLFKKVWDVTGQMITTIATTETDDSNTSTETETETETETKLDSHNDDIRSLLRSTPNTLKKVHSGLRLQLLDRNGDGQITVSELQLALQQILGLSVHPEEMKLAEFIHSYADRTGDGMVRQEDLECYYDFETKQNEERTITTRVVEPPRHGGNLTTNADGNNNDNKEEDDYNSHFVEYEEAVSF